MLFVKSQLTKHVLYPELQDRLQTPHTYEKLHSLIALLTTIAADDAFFLSLQDNASEAVPQLDKSIIFIVHGHDEEAKVKAENFVRKQGFKPIILVDIDSEGTTIIENIEQHSNVGFAIVLCTPDDAMADGQKRARQNVVFEHGYLTAKLGRTRVRALVKGTVEPLSDLGGVVYIPMDNGKEWERKMVAALKSAGYPADANKI